MNIERATELCREARVEADTLVGRAKNAGLDEADVNSIMNAEGWLAAALVGPERALNPEPNVTLLSVTLTEGLARAWWSLSDVGGDSICVTREEAKVYPEVDRCCHKIHEALKALDLTWENPIVEWFIPPPR